MQLNTIGTFNIEYIFFFFVLRMYISHYIKVLKRKTPESKRLIKIVSSVFHDYYNISWSIYDKTLYLLLILHLFDMYFFYIILLFK